MAFVLLGLLGSLMVHVATAENYYFDIVPDSFSCSYGADVRQRLQSFKLYCKDYRGCGRGAGVLADKDEETSPSFVHTIIHGCHNLDRRCTQTEFDGLIELCETLVPGQAADGDTFCSRRNRFGLTLPQFLYKPLRTSLNDDESSVLVSTTIDGGHFCRANYTITTEDEESAMILEYTSAIVLGVAFMLGVAMIIALLHQNKKELRDREYDREREPNSNYLEISWSKRGVK
ncbi:expressed unknown protein [Seminavis robusta]|uniref:Uncharacterized protein n=1 Tax=Seminavis robusta TaxID=568900 RepID=A0A9N8DWU7_9STRA|nr:expressed unknown protein [Seminavis robusta]|eukprot:Sro333_g119500.1 n/a (231) ;mRNA; r:27627-28435